MNDDIVQVDSLGIETSRATLAEMYPMSALEANKAEPVVRQRVTPKAIKPQGNQSSTLAQLTNAQQKLAAKWTEKFGAAPIEEIRGILRDNLGVNSEEVPKVAAERAIVLWVNRNELRMKRDLKNAPKGQ